MNLLSNLTEQEQTALNRFLTQVLELFNDDFRSAVLFGSKARGDFHAESDIDVALFLRRVDRQTKRGIYDLATELFLETDIEIAPLVFQLDQYEQMRADGYPIVNEIERCKVAL